MRTALVVIDMQNGFVNEHTAHVVPHVTELVRCSAENVDVVFTRFVNRAGSAFERLLGWNGLQTAPATDIVPELAALAPCIIDKHQYSAFTPELDALARSRSWQQVVLCGIATDACVLKTAFDAFERELSPVVVHDACASDGGLEAHIAGLLVIKRAIGKAQVLDAFEARRVLSSGG